ncbi:MAG: YciI family protein [Aeromonas sp.]
MWFLIFAQDNPHSLSARKAARPAHVARLQQLRDEGRLLTAGPHPALALQDPGAAGFTGSTIIAEFASQAAAEVWAAADPYVAAGVYAQVTIKPYKAVF